MYVTVSIRWARFCCYENLLFCIRNCSLDGAVFAPILHVFLQRFRSSSNKFNGSGLLPRRPSFPSQLQLSPAVQSPSLGASGEHWTGENGGPEVGQVRPLRGVWTGRRGGIAGWFCHPGAEFCTRLSNCVLKYAVKKNRATPHPTNWRGGGEHCVPKRIINKGKEGFGTLLLNTSRQENQGSGLGTEGIG